MRRRVLFVAALLVLLQVPSLVAARPFASIAQCRTHIGTYVDTKEVARLRRFVTIDT